MNWTPAFDLKPGIRWTGLALFTLVLCSCKSGSSIGSKNSPDQEKQSAPAKGTYVYVSNHESETLGVFRVDEDPMRLERVQLTSLSGGPGAQVFFDKQMVLFVAKRKDHSIAAYRINPKTGFLSLRQEISVLRNPAFLAKDQDSNFLLMTSTEDNSIASYAVDQEGTLSQTPSSDFTSPIWPHSIAVDPSNHFALVPKTGSDEIFQYLFDPLGGQLGSNPSVPFVTSDEGDNPRHLRFHGTLPKVYVANEKSDSVSVFDFDSNSGQISFLAKYSTLAEEDSSDQNHCADIEITPDGRYLYASNRGDDSLAIFGIDAASGLLDLIDIQSTEAKPREFSISPNGKFLFVAGQDSNHLSSYQIQDNGELLLLFRNQTGEAPVWVHSVELLQE